jgi:hypothetical protein
MIVGDADDQPLAAFERNTGFFIDRNRHDALAYFEEGFESSENVCRAIMSSSSVGTT